MGSPLSGFLKCLFLEFLESFLFRFIIDKDSNHYCYISDILLIYQWNNDFKIINRHKKIEPTINLICQLETNNTLSYLEILLINNYKQEFKANHKSTNKNDPYTFLFTSQH